MNQPKVDKAIFGLALAVILAFAIPLVIWPTEGKAALNTALAWTTKTIGWSFLWLTIGAFGVLIFFAFGRYGKVRFGGAGATPEFSMASWIAMLFCAGIGSGVMYWGTIEWAYYYTSPPFGMESGSKDAIEWAATYGLFHWGFTAWAVYCIPTLPLAYMYWNRKKSVLRLSGACEGVIGTRAANGPLGKLIDILFMFGLIGGVSTTIGLGTPMLSAGIAELFGIERSLTLDFIVIAIWGLIFGFSVYSGLSKGIKVLSDINLWLIGILLGCVFVFGPTVFQLDVLTNSLGLLLQNFLKMSFYLDPVTKAENIFAATAEGKSYVSAGGTFPEWWTIFYWAWWVAYAPFMGLFVARISRGRTIRQLIGAELVGGSIGCWVFFGLLGNSALFFQMEGLLDLTGMVADGKTPEAIIATVKAVGDRMLPLGTALVVVFVALAFIFGATTMDSSAYTLASVAEQDTGQAHEPSRWHRAFWAIVLSFVALALLYSGGSDALSALQAASVVVAVPLMPVLFIMVWSLIRWLREDHPELEPGYEEHDVFTPKNT